MSNEIESLHYKQVEVKDVGILTEVRNEIHARTNHYITQSRPFFPREKLRIYIDCWYFLNIARILCLTSLFGALVTSGGSQIIPVFFLVVCLLFFLVFCQHEWVNQKTLPVIHKQPVSESQRDLNAIYEVTITELDGVALQNYQAGIGFIKLAQGKIRFQAFSKQALKEMSSAKCQSRLMLFLFIMASAYNCYFAQYGSPPSKEEIVEAGNSCPICQEELKDPIMLRSCKHIFCEDCISLWFDRERTCPMCRAKVVADPTWRDGSTATYFILF